jgi:hypothetical protein
MTWRGRSVTGIALLLDPPAKRREHRKSLIIQ